MKKVGQAESKHSRANILLKQNHLKLVRTDRHLSTSPDLAPRSLLYCKLFCFALEASYSRTQSRIVWPGGVAFDCFVCSHRTCIFALNVIKMRCMKGAWSIRCSSRTMHPQTHPQKTNQPNLRFVSFTRTMQASFTWVETRKSNSGFVDCCLKLVTLHVFHLFVQYKPSKSSSTFLTVCSPKCRGEIFDPHGDCYCSQPEKMKRFLAPTR